MAMAEDPSELKCRYASKRCWNPRAIKRNGERHNLCELHRQKANSNQRRLDKKRKAGQLTLGLHGPLQSGLLPDADRRLRIRSSIALKLEKELVAGGVLPLTTQFIRPPMLNLVHADALASRSRDLEAARVLNRVAMSGHPAYHEVDDYPTNWEAEWPKSPRAMLRAAAALKREFGSPELRGYGGYSHYRRAEVPAPAGFLPPLATAVARSSQGLLASARSTAWQPERVATRDL